MSQHALSDQQVRLVRTKADDDDAALAAMPPR